MLALQAMSRVDEGVVFTPYPPSTLYDRVDSLRLIHPTEKPLNSYTILSYPRSADTI